MSKQTNGSEVVLFSLKLFHLYPKVLTFSENACVSQVRHLLPNSSTNESTVKTKMNTCINHNLYGL